MLSFIIISSSPSSSFLSLLVPSSSSIPSSTLVHRISRNLSHPHSPHCVFHEQSLQRAVLLVYANKQDVKGSMSAADVSAALRLHAVDDHEWHIQVCCGDVMMWVWLWWCGDMIVFSTPWRPRVAHSGVLWWCECDCDDMMALRWCSVVIQNNAIVMGMTGNINKKSIMDSCLNIITPPTATVVLCADRRRNQRRTRLDCNENAKQIIWGKDDTNCFFKLSFLGKNNKTHIY